jgi:hypothetical protein
MAIFSPLQQDVNPMDPIDVGSPVASGLASLSKLFLSAPEQGRAPTQDEMFGKRVTEFGQRMQKPDWSPVDATLGELTKFGKVYPEFASQVFTTAKTTMNEELLAAENAQTTTQRIQEQLEFDWNTSSEGAAANAMAANLPEEQRASFLAERRAEWTMTSAENAKIKREVETQGGYETLSAKAWKNNSFFAKTEADIFSRGMVDLTLAISADPTASFNLDEIPGVTQLIPELRGTVVNQRNIVSVGNIARAALTTRYRKEISSRTGIPEDQLGLSPEGWEKSVFSSFDSNLIWLEKELDPAAIQTRLEGEAFIEMANAGVPAEYLTIMSRLSGSNPQLQAEFMSSLTSVVGKFNENLMNGQLEEARRVLKESSVKELTDARYAFTELVAVMSGQSKLARTYEEVTQDQKDSEIQVALTGAIQAHGELQRVEGPTRWNRAAWKQTFEVPAEAITRRAATNKDFALETSRFLSSDIMLDLGNLRDAAGPNGVDISISENGQVVVSMPGQPPSAEAPRLGVARRPLTPSDKLNTFKEERKALIDDINYKMTVLGRLGDLGKSTLDIIRAEVPGPTVGAGAGNDNLGGDAGSDTLRGAGSGSTGTSAQITYALPEAIAADTAFLDKVVSVSSDLGFDPNDLLRVIDFETAGSFSPKAQPIRKDGTKISSATGLIQFLEETAKGLGTTTADLANMTAVEQLDYVKKYFEPFKDRIKNFGDVYMAVHWPKGVGKDDSYVMYRKDSEDPKIRAAYNSNKSLDTNGDGTVTRGETLARLFSATGKGGNPTAGTPANENTVAAAAGPAVQRAVNNAPSASSTMAATTPAAPTEAAAMEAVAALPEAIPAEVAATGTQGASELSPAIAIDQDVQAFIQEIAGDPDKTYASESEFIAAQEAGELEAGDTVVVDGSVYVIRKNGSARRLGSVNA